MAKLIEHPYYNSSEISNSKLAIINPEQGGSPKLWQMVNANMMEKKESLSLERGKLVHLFQLQPDEFKVADVTKPTPGVERVISHLAATRQQFNAKNLVASARAVGYQNNYTPATLEKQLNTKDNEKYYEYLIESDQYIFISHIEKHVIDNALTSIKNHPFANHLMNSNEWDFDMVENEIDLYAMDKTGRFKLKGLLDRLLIKHHEKRIIIPDLKTTSKAVDQFPEYFRLYHYYRQFAFYNHLVRHNFADLIDKGYVIENYSVVTNISPGGLFETRVFMPNSDWLEFGDQEIKNLLERVAYHEDNGWDYPMEHKDGFYTMKL